MASCRIGHVYIIETVLTKPPKAKFAVCVCIDNGFFVWMNSKPRPHGRDQMALKSGCHELVSKDCFLDLSRVVKHPTFEIEEAKEFSCISAGLADDIVRFIGEGLYVLPSAHADIIRQNLGAIR